MSSVLAAGLVAWFSIRADRGTKRRITLWLRRPLLAIRLHLSKRHRPVVSTIRQLFRAWEDHDQSTYAACWSEDCVRYRSLGAPGDINHSLPEILESFSESCEKYAELQVPWIIIEDFRQESDGSVTVQVAYRMCLLRTLDRIRLVEDGGEVYCLANTEAGWKVRSNWDRYQIVGGIADIV